MNNMSIHFSALLIRRTWRLLALLRCVGCFSPLLGVDKHSHRQPRRRLASKPVIVSSSSLTELRVSELHVPGYAETKLPFILTADVASAKLREQTFVLQDFESMLSFQNGHLIYRTHAPIFSVDECQRIIAEAEQVASEIEWTKNRHGNYPTTDLPLVELPDSLAFFRVALVERIYPALRCQFESFLPDSSKLRVADCFVVKYDALGGQTELKPHRDGSVLSFNIALNSISDFEGGGTWFASLDRAVQINQGEMISHASGILHGGHGITSGTRYILVAFVIVEGYDSWSMRFYNQIRNA